MGPTPPPGGPGGTLTYGALMGQTTDAQYPSNYPAMLPISYPKSGGTLGHVLWQNHGIGVGPGYTDRNRVLLVANGCLGFMLFGSTRRVIRYFITKITPLLFSNVTSFICNIPEKVYHSMASYMTCDKCNYVNTLILW